MNILLLDYSQIDQDKSVSPQVSSAVRSTPARDVDRLQELAGDVEVGLSFIYLFIYSLFTEQMLTIPIRC